MTSLRCCRATTALCCAALLLPACAARPALRLEEPGTAPAVIAIDVPRAPAALALARTRLATGLANPRGMHVAPDGSLLLAIAGTGDPEQPGSGGGLLKLRDINRDGDFDDPGERQELLADQPSRNLLELVRRDEVFGMGSVAEGAGIVLASLAQFGGPSTIYSVDEQRVTLWTSTHGNINDLAYDVRRQAWMAVASTTDEVVELSRGGRAQRVVKVPPLASGQDSVPAYLRYDPLTGDMLVTLFSGSPQGEEGGEGVELVPRSASIVRVHAETRTVTPVVTGLTVPTDLEITEDGSIYVLEFCDAFIDPVARREDLFARPMHGGFRRFSGRLLRVDRTSKVVTVVADGLDTPTNLERMGDALLISQGMGTPGRLIPGPRGEPIALTGFIERIGLVPVASNTPPSERAAP